ncbi:hypothetical protein [Reinekea sp. G2M2-21]|uniref:hypothetical protein n=1 Tax=Reinekea sp. G2M2-21 TaxID=2788942 RepID=UPI0018AC1658|nr:hypothetical protein [Reinekea sp. G2M2-21]
MSVEQLVVFYDEAGPNSLPSDHGRTWVQERIYSHRIGDRLPRGKKFEQYRHTKESKFNAQQAGKAILSELSSLLGK